MVTTHPLPLLAAAVIVLLCCAGIAAYVGWIPASPAFDGSAIPSKVDQALAPVLCGRCGVVEAVRERTLSFSSRGSVTGTGPGQQLIGFSRDLTNMVGLLLVALQGKAGHAAGPVTVQEVTVRFDDGSTRVVTEVNSHPRHPGERIKVVSGRIVPAPESGAAALAKTSR